MLCTQALRYASLAVLPSRLVRSKWMFSSTCNRWTRKFCSVDLPLATLPTVNRKLPVLPSIAEPSTTLSKLVMSMRLGPGSRMVPTDGLARIDGAGDRSLCGTSAISIPIVRPDDEQREERHDTIQDEADQQGNDDRSGADPVREVTPRVLNRADLVRRVVDRFDFQHTGQQ